MRPAFQPPGGGLQGSSRIDRRRPLSLDRPRPRGHPRVHRGRAAAANSTSGRPPKPMRERRTRDLPSGLRVLPARRIASPLRPLAGAADSPPKAREDRKDQCVISLIPVVYTKSNRLTGNAYGEVSLIAYSVLLGSGWIPGFLAGAASGHLRRGVIPPPAGVGDGKPSRVRAAPEPRPVLRAEGRSPW